MVFGGETNIERNLRLRTPQREGWISIRQHYGGAAAEREVGLVLPVGCGKSGLMAVTPFSVAARRVLVIAPGTRIRAQLADDLKSSSDTNFFQRFDVLRSEDALPTAAVIESGRINIDDLQHSDFAIANIQQIAGEENRWLSQLPPDFFDLILVDEAHHNTAVSWQQVKQRFPGARIVNYSATPTRADGRLMEGKIIYSYPVVRAIESGYVKRLRAKMLRPSSLRYVDRSDGQERTIGPDEVRALGESDAEFRRGIVMSDETLGSIVDCALGELLRLRRETGEHRLKIIASALNQAHCIQITEAFRARGRRAGYVHSNESTKANDRVLDQLERHELDVIVQARMLGEGFDHPYLAVAMVGSIYANLSPFVQFVGRVMRAIVHDAPGHPQNQGVVVFHAGANVAQRWQDFRHFSGADQAYFAHLLPEVEEGEFEGDVVDFDPGTGCDPLEPVEILEERDVRAADLEPIGDPVTNDLLRQLAERGITPDQAAQGIRRFARDRQDVREARRAALNERIQNETGGILKRLGMKAGGKSLDCARRRTNYTWTVAELHRRANAEVGGALDDRQNFTLAQVNAAHDALPAIVRALEEELRRAAS